MPGLFASPDPTEVYTWGNNTNFSLGHGNQESRQHPEIVDVFARSGVYIKQVNYGWAPSNLTGHNSKRASKQPEGLAKLLKK